MTHQDRGKYAAKHPEGTNVDERISNLVAEKLSDGAMPCAQAHRLAASLSVTPLVIGTAIDLLEGRIIQCQLGFFGYGGRKKMVRPSERIPASLKSIIEGRADAGRLDCAEVWRIAEEAGISRQEAADACEGLKVKIIRCQLGAF